jgi:hypothetical protein
MPFSSRHVMVGGGKMIISLISQVRGYLISEVRG